MLWEGAAISLLMLLFSPVTWKLHCVGVLPALYWMCRASLAGIAVPRAVYFQAARYTVLVVVLNRSIVGLDLTKLLDRYRVKTLRCSCCLPQCLCSSVFWRPVRRRRRGRKINMEGRH